MKVHALWHGLKPDGTVESSDKLIDYWTEQDVLDDAAALGYPALTPEQLDKVVERLSFASEDGHGQIADSLKAVLGDPA